MNTDTPSWTPTDTPSWTSSPTNTATPTPSSTPSATHSPEPVEGLTSNSPLIYPNPSQGIEQVQIAIPGLSGVSDIKVKVLTVGFRKVREETFTSVPKDGTITLRLRDNWNTALGNGLYYVLIETPKDRFMEKLIVLR
jgi:hypothetical protein